MRRESRGKDTRMEEGPPGQRVGKEVVCPKSDEKRESAAFFFSDEKGDQKQSVEKKKFLFFL